MDNVNENSEPEPEIIQTPDQEESTILRVTDILNHNEYMKFKLYENVKSRPVCINLRLIFHKSNEIRKINVDNIQYVLLVHYLSSSDVRRFLFFKNQVSIHFVSVFASRIILKH